MIRDSLWTYTLNDFLSRTASTEPTPGGGSVAAVFATLGMGLVVMALEISAKRLEGERLQEAEELIALARGTMTALKAMPDRDVAAFEEYMAALALPKQTGEEKSIRKEALQKAKTNATETPLEAARLIQEAVLIAERAVPFANKHVVSDVGAGAAMLAGAVEAILLNVDINTAGMAESVGDEPCEKQRYLDTAAEIRSGVREAADAVLRQVRGKIGGS